MRRVTAQLMSVIACAGLPGCGINALRTQYAHDVGSEGTAVAAGSSDFLHRVETSRRLANIELVVSDPACGNTPTIVRRAIRISEPAPGWLCLLPKEARQPGDLQFILRPLSSEVQPTILLIASLSAYTQAVADIVDSKPADPMKPLADALATARSAQGLLLAVSGEQNGPVPAADDKRVKAVGDFVSFLAQLSEEADQVRRLRQMIATRPDGAQPLVAALQDHLGTWEISRKGDDGLRLAVTGAVLRRTLDAKPPVPAEARRQALTNFYQIQDAVGAAAGIYPALSKSLADLEEADGNLRRVLVEHPNLSRAERAKVAELNRERAIRTMDMVAALITSFKGA